MISYDEIKREITHGKKEVRKIKVNGKPVIIRDIHFFPNDKIITLQIIYEDVNGWRHFYNIAC